MGRILVAESQPYVSRVVCQALDRIGYETKEVVRANEVLDCVLDWSPHMVTLCNSLDMPGPELCRRIRTMPHGLSIGVVFISALYETKDITDAFDAGADDYVVKPFDVDELLCRVRALLRRCAPGVSNSLRVGELVLDCQNFIATTSNGKSLLTGVEFDLLSFLMHNAGTVFPYDALLQHVWGYPKGMGSPALVRVHIRNLRGKLEPNPSKPVYLQTVRGHGYVVREEASE